MSEQIYDSTNDWDWNSENPLERNLARHTVVGAYAGFGATALVTAYLYVSSIMSVAQDPGIIDYVVTSMPAAICGAGVGTVGALGGFLVGLATGASQGGIETLVQKVKN
ncbi:hypothetical protein HOK51_01805 [Candidatus Woesearchaeota archaeon]|jgi:hypothetical protein|nr:hypothetical protein [Candidatus Woesearchaeota archaeon]MBT6518550.1 hypothetical protein [Candidatus Woesearchaeota archaeon]MBT7368422.1 hypothetical protein [Candidatus Woesearchaeota archaeon]